MSGSGVQPYKYMTGQGFPQHVEIEGLDSYSVTTPKMERFLQFGADYWNKAYELSAIRTGSNDTRPLLGVTNDLSKVRDVDVRVGFCELDGLSGYYIDNKICMNFRHFSGKSTHTLAHEIGHYLGFEHVDFSEASVMNNGWKESFYYENWPCHVDVDHPFEHDIQLVSQWKNNYASHMPPFRHVTEETFEIPDYPTCQFNHSIPFLISEGLKRTVPSLAAGFFTGIVDDVLRMDFVKKLSHYEYIKSVSHLLPHVLFIVSAMSIYGMSLTTAVGAGAMIGLSLVNKVFRNPCIEKYMQEHHAHSWKGFVYSILSHPLLPMALSGLSLSTYSLAHTRPVLDSVAILVTEIVSGMAGPVFTYGIGRGISWLARSSAHCLKQAVCPKKPVFFHLVDSTDQPEEVVVETNQESGGSLVMPNGDVSISLSDDCEESESVVEFGVQELEAVVIQNLDTLEESRSNSRDEIAIDLKHNVQLDSRYMSENIPSLTDQIQREQLGITPVPDVALEMDL